MDGDDGLCQLLDQELEEEMLLVQGSATTLVSHMSQPCGLTPVRKTLRANGSFESLSLKPVLSRLSLGGDSPPESTQHVSDR